MKNIINFLKNTLKRYIDSFKRFPVCQCLMVAYGLFLCLSIIFEFDDCIYISIALGFAVSLIFSFLVTFYTRNNALHIALPIALLVLVSTILYFNYDNHYILLGTIGLYIFIFCLLLYKLLKIANGNLFIYLISKCLYASVLCGIITFGLIICTAGFQFLIYDFSNMGKVYLIILTLVDVVLYGTLYVSYLPDVGEKLTYNDVFTSLLSKIPLSLYYLLLVILYVYLIKIVVTWTLPVGVINWFASFALFFYIYFSYASSDDYFLSKFHQKYGSYVLIPIFIIQQISIFIRVNAYGLTELRVLSLVFNLIGLILILLNIFKKRYLFFLIAGIIILIFTAIPYTNIIDLPAIEQEARLKRVLIDNNMYKDGEIIVNASLTKDTKDKIVSCYNFLSNSASNKTSLITRETDFKKTFGFDDGGYGTSDGIEYCSYSSYVEKLDIKGYNSIEFTDYIEIEDDLDFEKYCEEVYQEYGDYSSNAQLIYKNNDNEVLYIEYLYFERDINANINHIEVKGFKLVK